MNDSLKPQTDPGLSRRSFLKSTSTAVAGGTLLSALPIERFAHAASPGDTLRISLVGCGGRGRGAAVDSLSGPSDLKLVALADATEQAFDTNSKKLFSPIEKAMEETNKAMKDRPERVAVKADKRFIGFDAYKAAIAEADVVILATPPGLRPMQFEEAIRQNKHVFMEKPVAVDAPGVRRVLAAAEEAKKKNLKVGVGLQRRHQTGYLETIKRIQDGAIGDVSALRAYWNGSTPWIKRRADLEAAFGRKLTEFEYQFHNWYYFVWMCGDHICEQHIHNLDVANWIKGTFPERARGNGGCQTRKGKDYGEIFDHHVVEYFYEDGTVLFSQCRHQNGCWGDVSEHAIGTKGSVDFDGRGYTIRGENAWRRSEKDNAPYKAEHVDLYNAIRNDKPYNEAFYGAMSTMTAILGRMATYSGKEITMKEALASDIDTMPKTLAWDAEPPVKPDADGLYKLAIPGVTDVLRARKA
jgi:myo-inositol 2-dehydrogenase/D-chiro-inositol 1-dehydrogenase